MEDQEPVNQADKFKQKLGEFFTGAQGLEAACQRGDRFPMSVFDLRGIILTAV